MLTSKELKEFRLLRGLSLRDVAEYCDVTPQLIGQIENGDKDVTEYNHAEIVKGINTAFAAKVNGTFKRETISQQPKKEDSKEEKTKKENKVTKSVKK